MKISYDKAVRDRIPEIIRASGSTCLAKNLSDEEFLPYMERKLGEELSEYHASKDVTELADIIEVVYRIAELRNITHQELENIRLEKNEERGAFMKNVVLIETS